MVVCLCEIKLARVEKSFTIGDAPAESIVAVLRCNEMEKERNVWSSLGGRASFHIALSRLCNTILV